MDYKVFMKQVPKFTSVVQIRNTPMCVKSCPEDRDSFKTSLGKWHHLFTEHPGAGSGRS